MISYILMQEPSLLRAFGKLHRPEKVKSFSGLFFYLCSYNLSKKGKKRMCFLGSFEKELSSKARLRIDYNMYSRIVIF